MRVLHVTSREAAGVWLSDALLSDSASRVELEKSVGMVAGLGRLRNEVFDAMLVDHRPGQLDALEMVEAVRAGDPDLAIIVLGALSEQEMGAPAFETGADGYVCINTATTRGLIWLVARAIERHQLVAENRRLRQAESHRLAQDQREVDRLLDEQRVLIRDLEAIRRTDEPGDEQRGAAAGESAVGGPIGGPIRTNDRRALKVELPDRLAKHYRELLRAYVIMGSGSLCDEMETLAELFASVGATARQAMLLHLKVLEELIGGLGNRSARHVMNRADLLVVEMMVHLAEKYRDRFLDQVHPRRQLTLPGM
jgi:DNA-binding response OmpR family regulator